MDPESFSDDSLNHKKFHLQGEWVPGALEDCPAILPAGMWHQIQLHSKPKAIPKDIAVFPSYLLWYIGIKNMRHVHCRSVGARVSATRFPAVSAWRPASFSSSSLTMSFFISTGEITSIILGFYFPTASRATTTMTTCSTSTTDKPRQLLAIIRFEDFWGESNGQKSCFAHFKWNGVCQVRRHY